MKRLALALVGLMLLCGCGQGTLEVPKDIDTSQWVRYEVPDVEEEFGTSISFSLPQDYLVMDESMNVTDEQLEEFGLKEKNYDAFRESISAQFIGTDARLICIQKTDGDLNFLHVFVYSSEPIQQSNSKYESMSEENAASVAKWYMASIADEHKPKYEGIMKGEELSFCLVSYTVGETESHQYVTYSKGALAIFDFAMGYGMVDEAGEKVWRNITDTVRYE